MLTLRATQTECLWDEGLPVEVRELPEDLAGLDWVLADPALMSVVPSRFQAEAAAGRSVICDGRPTIAMETLIRLLVLKHRYRWGYRVLVAEVSDSIHLRRFCRISLSERVPDESTVRKLVRRLGAETVNELVCQLIETATRERRFRPRAVRVDSTVVEADVRYPTDADLAAKGVKILARDGARLGRLIKEKRVRVRDRSRSMGIKLRALGRTVKRRSGEAKTEVLALTEQTGRVLETSVNEARKLARVARQRARGRGAKTKLAAAKRLEELADRCEKIASQIRQRVAGKPISDRLISLADPDARPIRKGKLGNPAEDTLLPDTLKKLTALGIKPREIALDGGFNTHATRQALDDQGIEPDRVFISGRQQPGSRRTQRRLQRYRTGAEGRISHLKRQYGLGRSRLKDEQGHQIWTGWAILAYNADTLTIRAR